MQKLTYQKQRTILTVILPIVVLSVSVGSYVHAVYAQQDVSSLANLSASAVLSLIGIGLLAVTLQSYQGWSTSGEKFVPKAFFDRILLGSIHSIALAIGAASQYATLSPITYVLIFLSAVGATELTMKQLSNAVSSSPGPASPGPQDLPAPPGPGSSASPESPASPAPQAKTVKVGDVTLTQETG